MTKLIEVFVYCFEVFGMLDVQRMDRLCGYFLTPLSGSSRSLFSILLIDGGMGEMISHFEISLQPYLRPELLVVCGIDCG